MLSKPLKHLHVECRLPLVGRHIPAGFPSPADDFLEGEIDINAYLIQRPAATYVMRVSGHSMEGAGILDGDYVVVDRSIAPIPGHIVVAALHGELTLKRLSRAGERLRLIAEHPDYPAIEISERTSVEIWGVVVGSFRRTV